jgi:hypothetical protein
LWSPTLSSGSCPVGLLPVPWTEKNNWKFTMFRPKRRPCCRGDLVARTTFWIFFSGLHKLELRAKKCIELRGEYVEISRVWSLSFVSFLVGFRTYQHPLICNTITLLWIIITL